MRMKKWDAFLISQVYFWLLHVRASIECPSRRAPSPEDFQLRLIQLIDRSEAGSSRSEADEAYERGDSFHFPGLKVSWLNPFSIWKKTYF